MLVVDDDEGVRTAVAWALEADGFMVMAVENGIAAMHAIESSLPALVVLDLSLPGLGGLDILKRLRSSEERKPRAAEITSARNPVKAPLNGSGR